MAYGSTLVEPGDWPGSPVVGTAVSWVIAVCRPCVSGSFSTSWSCSPSRARSAPTSRNIWARQATSSRRAAEPIGQNSAASSLGGVLASNCRIRAPWRSSGDFVVPFTGREIVQAGPSGEEEPGSIVPDRLPVDMRTVMLTTQQPHHPALGGLAAVQAQSAMVRPY